MKGGFYLDSYENKKIQNSWHSISIDKTLNLLHTSEDGLTESNVQKRLKKYGANELKSKPRRTIFQLILEELKDPMILILIFASFLSFILKEQIESYVILFIVLLNATISIIQERKAEASIEALKSMSGPTCHVFREKKDYLIPASDLVPGDIVLLEAGNMIPADLRLIHSSSLKVQESALTGESVPVEKDATIVLPSNQTVSDRINMAYRSSFVTYGRGIGVVVATGMDTQVGHIASMLNEENNFDTPLKRKLTAVGKTLSIVGLIICFIIFGVRTASPKTYLTIIYDSNFSCNFYYSRGASCYGYHCYGSWSKTYGKRKCINENTSCC